MPNALGGRHGVKTLNRLAIYSRWSVRFGGVEHYVNRQSESDANAPVLAPPDYLLSSVIVPPSTVGFTHCFESHPDGGCPISPWINRLTPIRLSGLLHHLEPPAGGGTDLTQSRTRAVALSGLYRTMSYVQQVIDKRMCICHGEVLVPSIHQQKKCQVVILASHC